MYIASHIQKDDKMKEYLKIALVAIVAVAIAKKIPMVNTYLA